ncbi:hypothetical protein RCL1_005140 [Eukaryota sp. TZLM3-RCL]
MISVTGLRSDGRRPKEVRQIFFEINKVPKADGSCYYRHGQTELLVSVFGPQEALRRKDVIHDTVSVRVEFGQSLFASGDKRERRRTDRFSVETASRIKSIVEQQVISSRYPKSEIVVSIQLLQSDGSILPCAINATILALIDAGISMTDFVVATSVGLVNKDILVDLTQTEENGPCNSLVLALAVNDDQCSLLFSSSRIPVDVFPVLYNEAAEVCRVLHSMFAANLKSFVATRVVE